MEHINALKVRNNLGEILERLHDTKEPIFITKGRKVRAVLEFLCTDLSAFSFQHESYQTKTWLAAECLVKITM